MENIKSGTKVQINTTARVEVVGKYTICGFPCAVDLVKVERGMAYWTHGGEMYRTAIESVEPV